MARSGRSYVNRISWSTTNEQKTLQVPTGKETAKPLPVCSGVEHGARMGHPRNRRYGMCGNRAEDRPLVAHRKHWFGKRIVAPQRSSKWSRMGAGIDKDYSDRG